MSKFSNRLKNIRLKRNISRKALAQKVDLSYSTIAKYENGEREPDISTLNKLALSLEVSVDYLAGKSNNENSDDSNLISEVNCLLKEFGIEYSGFHDIDRWKALGPEELKELENYFKYITDMAMRKKEENDDEPT
ncbi:helix-turn-helix domain-containing protein [Gracilibacillus saliphilus]|uniref:helix-turn-helix domain-containing protein n=1 Tax=Gracilibacillus saliphilus TaxID=543890 RepID=UPI0013D5E6E7|nr:helix-turn-helix transcriptional regulator [Gracilibacillus saliphilus]